MVTADVSVRVAWPADAAAIAALQVRLWQARYDALPLGPEGETVTVDDVTAAWQGTLSRPPEARHRALVALQADVVRGFALTVPATDPDADPSDGEVLEFSVDPDHRRQGHGSRLLQACVDTLVADRFVRATCWVAAADDELRAFLTGAGWAADGARRELATDDPAPAAASVRQVRLHTAL